MLTGLMVVLPAVALAISANDQVLTPRTFIDLAKQVRPEVVSIKINAQTLEKFEQWRRERQAQPRQPLRIVPPGGQGEEGELDIPDWLREFFKNAPGLQMPVPLPEQDIFKYPYGAGSGMIVRSDGYILTNRHVLYHPVLGEKMFKEGQITVVLADGRKFTGDQVKVAATDQLTDLAVLKIEAKDLATIKWGDSEKLQVGEWVMAIGDPLELTGSVSQGIISGTGREVEIAGYPRLIQTDAVINPGNSGGPLVNLDGEVVGMNMAIASTTRLWSGVGFAIPSEIARKIANDLIEVGHPVRGYVGIKMIDPEKFPAFASDQGYKGENWVGVKEAYADLPAAKAGLRRYDIITKIDGKDVKDNLSLIRTVTAHRPGDKMTFEVFRGGKTETLTVTAGEWPTEEKLMALTGQKTEGKTVEKAEAEEAQPQKGRIGLMVENYPLNPNAPEEERGVVIRQIRAGSPAASAQPRLQVGDVILDVEKQRVHNTDEFKTIVSARLAEIEKSKAKEAKPLLLRVKRDDQAPVLVYLPLTGPENL
jgi:serine protease Do